MYKINHMQVIIQTDEQCQECDEKLAESIEQIKGLQQARKRGRQQRLQQEHEHERQQTERLQQERERERLQRLQEHEHLHHACHGSRTCIICM